MKTTNPAAAHTPGPWTADRHFIHSPTLRFVAIVSDGPQQESDARLIASAPDLLAALEQAEKDLAVLRTMSGGEACRIADTANRCVRAALAKAKGQP